MICWFAVFVIAGDGVIVIAGINSQHCHLARAADEEGESHEQSDAFEFPVESHRRSFPALMLAGAR